MQQIPSLLRLASIGPNASKGRERFALAEACVSAKALDGAQAARAAMLKTERSVLSVWGSPEKARAPAAAPAAGGGGGSAVGGGTVLAVD